MNNHHSNTYGFVTATFALLMAFAASSAPIPLYDFYHRENGVTYNELALTSVFYFIGAVSALLFLGRISNYIGRKPVAFIVLALSTAATILFLNIDSATPLIIGRLLLGIACGLASSGIAAYIGDTAPEKPEWLSSATISNTPFLGLTIGAIASGYLVEYAPMPRHLCYYIILSGLGIYLALTLFSRETIDKKPGLLLSLKPHLSLPESKKHLYPVAAAIFLGTWATGGYFQTFGPSIVANQLGSISTLVASIVFSAYLFPGIIGATIAARFSPAKTQTLGMAFYSIGLIVIIFSMKFQSITAFIIGTLIAGVSQGATFTASVRSLISGIHKNERAGVLSIVFTTSYLGAAISSFLSGQLSNHFDLFQITICYGGIAISVCLFTFLFPKRQMISS